MKLAGYFLKLVFVAVVAIAVVVVAAGARNQVGAVEMIHQHDDTVSSRFFLSLA